MGRDGRELAHLLRHRHAWAGILVLLRSVPSPGVVKILTNRNGVTRLASKVRARPRGRGRNLKLIIQVADVEEVANRLRTWLYK